MQHYPLGPYDLHEVLGRGGMGTVFLGVHHDTGRKAAVKVLAPTFAADSGFRERFEAEIRSLEKLRHPHIVELYGYGEEKGTLFYAMELVDGTSLQDELVQGRQFHWREVTQIGIEVCGALKHAHDHGIIHRDIKPANLLLTKREAIKLTDFGIAKLFGNTQITVDGGVLGTADYMSPEQADGVGATSKSDLYGVGAVLYCLLTGRPPFRGKSMAEVIHKVRYEEPSPVLKLAGETPVELAQLVEKLLSKTPDERVPTALALANRLRAIQHALTLRIKSADGGVLHVEEDAVDAAEISEEAFAELETVAESAERAQSIVGNPAAVKLSLQGPHAADEAARTHFTTVAEKRLDHDVRKTQSDEEPLWLRAAQITLLTLLLAGLVIFVWWLRRPPDADTLFAQIETAMVRGGDALVANESRMRAFLNRFPEEPRVPKVEEILEELELEQLERQLEVTARLRNASRILLPVEQVLVEALKKESLNPDMAAQEFADIIAVFASDANATDREKQCIRIAQRHLRRLTSQFRRSADTYVEALQGRIAFAENLRDDNPEEARRILTGIVRLYQDKPWARDVVRQAADVLSKRAFQRRPEVGTSTTSDRSAVP